MSPSSLGREQQKLHMAVARSVSVYAQMLGESRMTWDLARGSRRSMGRVRHSALGLSGPVVSGELPGAESTGIGRHWNRR
jgi:hypothetical protein